MARYIVPNRRGQVFVDRKHAGTIEVNKGVYSFTYLQDYLSNAEARPISWTMPFRPEPYSETTIFPFFDGLIPEGWLLEVLIKKWKLDSRDRLGLLFATGKDCIGIVSLVPDEVPE